MRPDMRTGGNRTARPGHQLTDSDICGGIDFVGSEQRRGFGLYDFITLVKETGDFAPVYKMLDELGLIGMPKEASPDGKNYHHEINQAVVVFSELMREANKSAPSAMDMTMKLSKLHKEVSDIIVRVQQGETA